MKTPGGNHLFTIILTGLSGAGKTVALNALEDSGFFCVDNLPTSLIRSFVDLCYRTPAIKKIALGVDVREREFLTDFSNIIGSLRRTQRVEIIFLEAQEDALIRRFKETRRPHPLGYRDIKKAIHHEAKLLSDIRGLADRIIDTSPFTPHDLRKIITRSYAEEGKTPLSVTLISFGYKYGIPQESDILFDVRFLPNPNFIEKLKPLPGTNAKVRDFVLRHKNTGEFLKKLYSLLNFLIPLYKEEGRSYLTIGIGCTGGRHRSPALVQEIKKSLKGKNVRVSIIHRDME